MVLNAYLSHPKRGYSTIEDKINKYSVREYLNAKKARELQNIIGRPSNQDLINYVERNMILNCPITKQDILRKKTFLDQI